jgi:hypothetical protein
MPRPIVHADKASHTRCSVSRCSAWLAMRVVHVTYCTSHAARHVLHVACCTLCAVRSLTQLGWLGMREARNVVRDKASLGSPYPASCLPPSLYLASCPVPVPCILPPLFLPPCCLRRSGTHCARRGARATFASCLSYAV